MSMDKFQAVMADLQKKVGENDPKNEPKEEISPSHEDEPVKR